MGVGFCESDELANGGEGSALDRNGFEGRGAAVLRAFFAVLVYLRIGYRIVDNAGFAICEAMAVAGGWNGALLCLILILWIGDDGVPSAQLKA